MRFRITDLEDRIVLDAALVDADGDDNDAPEAEPVVIAPDAPADSVEAAPHVLLVSSRVQDADTLANAADDNVIVIEYDAETATTDSLLVDINAALDGQKAASIGIAAHDVGVGGFSLTDDVVVADGDGLADQAGFWSALGATVAEGGRIDLLACDLAGSAAGLNLVESLRDLSGVQVAASTDATGNADAGGDWILETHDIDAADVYFSAESLALFEGQLAGNTPTFDTTADTLAVEDTAYQYDISATDPEGDSLSFHAVTESVDQSNSGVSLTVLHMPSDGWQSFTAGSDGWMTALDLRQYSSTVDRTISIYDGEGTGGNLLYSQTFEAGGANESWRHFEFDDALELDAGSQYTIHWDAGGASAGIYFDLSGDSYAGGRMDLLPNFDYLFQTYMATETSDATPDWLTLTDNGDGTAILAGTPDATDLGDHDIMLIASDGTTGAVQDFSLFVNDMPRVTGIVKTDPEPIKGSNLTYEVTFSEDITGLDADDFAIFTAGTVNGHVSSITGSGSVYTIRVSGIQGEGELRLDLADNDTVIDADGTALGGTGLGNGDFTGETYWIDTTPPTADIVDLSPDPTNDVADAVSVVFSESVSGVDINDFSLTLNGADVDLTGASLTQVSASEYTIDLSAVTTLEGDYVLTLNESGSGIVDLAGHDLADDASDAWTADYTAPTATLSDIPDLLGGDAGTVTLNFSEAVSGLDLSDFALTRDGTAVDLSGATLTQVSGTEYTLNLAAVTSADGDYVLALEADGSIADLAGNAMTATVTEAFTVDSTAPVVAFSDIANLVNSDAGTLTVIFSEDVSGVDIGDFNLTLDGVAVDLSGATLTQLSGSEYTLDLATATNLEGAYELTLAGSGSDIADAAGNLLAQDTAEAWTADFTTPTADVEEVLPDPNNVGAGKVSVWFSEDVTGVDIGDFTLTRDGAEIDLTGVTVTQVNAAEYELDLTWLTNVEGDYVLTLNADGSGIADAAGNALESDAFDAWETDLTGPAANIVEPPALSNTPAGPLSVVFSEAVSGVDASDFALTRDGVAVDLTGATVTQISATEYELDLGNATAADGTYELSLQASGSGITDSVGNELVFDAAETWTLDTVTPSATLSDVADLTNTVPGVLTVTFSEAVSGVDLADFTLTSNGEAVDLSGATLTQIDGTTYELDLGASADTDGDYVLALNATGSGIADAAGNALNADAAEAWVMDATAPSATLSDVADLTNTAPGVLTVTFSEAVSGVDLADFTLTSNGEAVDLSGATLTQIDGTTYEIDLGTAADADGDYALTLNATGSGIVDAAGNALEADAAEAWVMDATAPTAVISPVGADGVATITFSEAVGGVDIGDFVLVVDGQVVDMTGLEVVQVSDTVYTIDLSSVVNATGEHTITLTAQGSGITDAAGNDIAGDASHTWSVDNDAPEVVSVVRADNAPVHLRGNTAEYTVTFSEGVSGVDVSDFQLNTTGNLSGTISSVTAVSDSVYTVTVSNLTGSGKLELEVVDNDSIQDDAGNALGGEGSGNGDFDDGEHYTVSQQQHCNPWARLIRHIVVQVVRHMRSHWGLFSGLHRSFVQTHSAFGSPFAQEIHEAHVSMRSSFRTASRGFSFGRSFGRRW